MNEHDDEAPVIKVTDKRRFATVSGEGAAPREGVAPPAGDDVADEVTQLVKAKSGGMGEHAPHAIAYGADGFLYIMYGNHSYPDFKIEADSPSRGFQEDFLSVLRDSAHVLYLGILGLR